MSSKNGTEVQGGYNNKDCFMRETDQEGYVDFVKTVRIL